MLTNKWGKRIASLISMMFVLMLLVSTLSVTVFAAETAPLATASEESGGNFWVITLGVVAAVLLLVCAVLVYLLKTQKEGFLGKIAELQHKYKALGKLQNETQQNFDYAEQEIAAHEEWQESALKIDPKLQSKINNAQYQMMAEQFTNDYLQVELSDRSTAETFAIIDRILRAYNALDPAVRSKVTTDMGVWQKQYDTVLEAYIKEANATLIQVKNECGAYPSDLKRLREAINYYQALPQVVKGAIPNLLIGKIRAKVASAEMHLPVSPNGEEDDWESDFAGEGE